MSHELRFERAFDASPEEVFDAFVDPEGLEEMYGADEPGWIVESQGEVRVGGAWSVAFGPSRDELYRFTHVFWVVDRPQRVAFATTETAPDGTILDLDVELTFEEWNGKTLMTVVQRGFPSAELRDLHEVGQPNAFDRLASRVYARRSGPATERCRR
jgi:uncharacterized protein YndB with AHSA1/START domain